MDMNPVYPDKEELLIKRPDETDEEFQDRVEKLWIQMGNNDELLRF